MSIEAKPAPRTAWLAGGRSGLVYGADYNPDQWPPEVWAEDVRLMREAGINLVSVGIFSWARLEPAPGETDFEWLAQVLDMLHDAGVSVDLATPTAAPPAWLVERHPEILPVDERGLTLRPGSRRHYCPHSPVYREAARRIARSLAERFGSHPALAMWHVDNEYGCHVGECFCERSRAAFRSWLKARYETIDALNAAWGTAVWGQTYGAWSQVEPPRPLPTFGNPGHELDWRRFCSDSWIDCFLDQKAILRKLTPEIPVTTNFMGFHPGIDYFALAAVEDLVAQDSYPETSDPDWRIEAAMTCDMVRSLGGRRPWLLMEQAVAYATWREQNSTKRPGVMRLASYQSIARGADGVMFFQWRTAPAGPEMHTVGLISHTGTDNRQWREAVALGAELPALAEIRGSLVRARVAIVFDWVNRWALETEGKLDTDVKLMPLVSALYRALFEMGVTVDFVRPGGDLSGYSLVLVPYLYLVGDAVAASLRRYVEAGGTLLMSFFSGLVDEHVRIRPGACPPPFAAMLGLHVEEFAPFAGPMSNAIRTGDGRTFDCRIWGEVVRADGAETLATFASDFYAGLPAVTRHAFGKGTAMYMATFPDPDGIRWTVERACEVAGVARVAGIAGGHEAPAAVEIVERADGDRSWLFVLNHADRQVEIVLDRPGVELLSGRKVAGSLTVGPVDVAVVARG